MPSSAEKSKCRGRGFPDSSPSESERQEVEWKVDIRIGSVNGRGNTKKVKPIKNRFGR